MDFFSKLEFNRLIKELDFIDSDLIYKSSVLKLADENFIKDVNQVIETSPQLKEILDEKTKKRHDIINQQQVINIEPSVDLEEDIIYETKNPKLTLKGFKYLLFY